MTEATYSLREVAAQHLPAEWVDGERWLARRINRGELHGVKFGRVWRMRERDVEHMLTRYANDGDRRPAPTPHAVTVVDGLSPRSRRRLRRSA